MKKLKANVLLTTFVLMIAILFAGAFMVDMVTVILSRYQLQKATEGFALEYTSSFSKAIEDRTMHASGDFLREELERPYETMYNTQFSGIINFQPKNIRYLIHSDIEPFNSDYKKDVGVIRITTEANAYPVFLRFVGVSDIRLHATAYTRMERTDGATGISRLNTDITRQLMPQIKDGGYTNFNFGGNTILTNKPRGNGDFAVEYGDGSEDNKYPIGGFFIFGGYKGDSNNLDDDNLMWVDLGDSASYVAVMDDWGNITRQDVTKSLVDVNGHNYTCIKSENFNPVVFSLNDNQFTKKLSRIKIYRAKGKNDNPCESCKPEDGEDCGLESTQLKQISLIILNHVSLITKNDFEEFEREDACGSSGCASGEATFSVNR